MISFSTFRSVAPILALAALASVTSFPASAHLGLDLQIGEMDARIEAAPRDATLRVRRGELCRLHGDLAAAMRDLKAARRLDPALAVVDFHLGRVHLDAGRLRAAERAFTRFLSTTPTHVTAHVERARTRLADGRAGAAADDFTRAIELQRTAGALPRPAWFIERARALAGDGDARLGEAVRGLDEGFELLGRPVTLQLEAISLELRAGNIDGALARLRAEAERTPRPETWLERIGEVESAAGRTDAATRSFRAALEALERVPTSRRWTPATRALDERVRAALARLEAGGSVTTDGANP